MFGAVAEEAQEPECSFTGGVAAAQDGHKKSGGEEQGTEDDGADQDGGQGGGADGQAGRGQDPGSEPRPGSPSSRGQARP